MSTPTRDRRDARKREDPAALHEAAWPDMFANLQSAYADLTRKEREIEHQVHELEETRDLFQQVIESMSDSLFVLDPAGCVQRTNRSARVLLEREEAEMIGRPLTQLTGTAGIPETPWQLLERAPEGQLHELEVDARTRGGHAVPLSLSCGLVRDKRGKVTGVLVVARDIAERRRAEQERQHLADAEARQQALQAQNELLQLLILEDPLTGLLNHRAFQERLQIQLEHAAEAGYPVSVVALDIDRFKEINDTHGHVVGDEALRCAAQAIKSELRPLDLSGRVGGDEFTLALVEAEAGVALGVVERLRSAISAMAFGPTGEHIKLSAGIAEFPLHAPDQAELIRLADGALYQAKRQGRDRSVVFSDGEHPALSAAEEAENARKNALLNTVHALARAVDAKDGYTHGHSHRVAFYGFTLAQELGIDGEQLELVRRAGVLHDVGKIGIPDAILLKPDKLTADEFDEMKRHSELGRDIVAGAGMPEVARWVLHLHERFDGRGYPHGLAGVEIPFESRVLAAADALEAMTSNRLYRNARPTEDALVELERSAGSHFDPHVAHTLVELVRSGALIVGEGALDGEPGRGEGSARTRVVEKASSRMS